MIRKTHLFTCCFCFNVPASECSCTTQAEKNNQTQQRQRQTNMSFPICNCRSVHLSPCLGLIHIQSKKFVCLQVQPKSHSLVTLPPAHLLSTLSLPFTCYLLHSLATHHTTFGPLLLPPPA